MRCDAHSHAGMPACANACDPAAVSWRAPRLSAQAGMRDRALPRCPIHPSIARAEISLSDRIRPARVHVGSVRRRSRPAGPVILVAASGRAVRTKRRSRSTRPEPALCEAPRRAGRRVETFIEWRGDAGAHPGSRRGLCREPAAGSGADRLSGTQALRPVADAPSPRPRVLRRPRRGQRAAHRVRQERLQPRVPLGRCAAGSDGSRGPPGHSAARLAAITTRVPERGALAVPYDKLHSPRSSRRQERCA